MSSGKEPSISSHPKRSGKEPSISSHPKRFGKEPSISSHPKRFGKEPSISSHPKRSRKEPSISSNPKRFEKELLISSEKDPRRSGKVVVGPQFTQPNKQDRDEELDNGDRKFYLLEDMPRTKVFDEPLPELITDAFGFITKVSGPVSVGYLWTPNGGRIPWGRAPGPDPHYPVEREEAVHTDPDSQVELRGAKANLPSRRKQY